MASKKYLHFSNLADEQTRQVTESMSSWTNFLSTAGRLYKYPFEEQLMIHAQRPNALACAPIDVWNKPMNRFVKRGSKGIALLDNTGNEPKLKYVFDVADTLDGWRNPHRPFLWEMKSEHEAPVWEALSKFYNISGDCDNMGETLYGIASVAAAKYYEENKHDILFVLEDSFLAGQSDSDKCVAFVDSLTVSTAYALMSRCGIETAAHLTNEDFQSVFDFNTPESVFALGKAVSVTSEEILREIEVAIKKHERQKISERNSQHERTHLQPERGLFNPQHNNSANIREFKPLRNTTEELPPRQEGDSVHTPRNEGNIIRPLFGNREASGDTVRGNNERAEKPAAEQDSRPDSMDGTHEQVEKPSRRNNNTRDNLQLSLSDIPETPIEITQEDIDNAIISWNGKAESKLRVFEYMSENARARDTANFLKQEFGGSGDFTVTKDGAESLVLPWAKVQRRIGQLMGEEKFLANDELPTQAPTTIIADFVKSKLEAGEKFSSAELFAEATKAYGGTMSNNAFTSKDAYDYMELGVNQYILSLDTVSIDTMLKMLDLLPSQTKRTADMEKFQQFSTPPSIAYLANWAANVNNNDIVLEPSAGIGGIAVFAKKDGAAVYVNELDKRRLEIIKNLPFDGFFNEDAEQINNIHGDKIAPTVIVMNPPFSSSAERNIQNTKIGAKHIEESLKMLAPNGRLVAIVGQGMADDAPAFRNWWREIKKQYNVKANIGVDGKNYNKYGTNFGIQMLVIDKDGATIEPTKTAFISSLLELQDILEGIRNGRPSFQYENVHGIEQRPTTATRIDTTSERESQHERNDTVLDTSSGTDSAVVRTRHEPPDTSEIVAPISGAAHVESEAANFCDDGLAPDVNAERNRGNDGRNDTDSGVGRVGVTDSGQSAGGISPLIQAKPVKTELTDSIFEQYEPQPLLLKNVQQHPANISESAAMSAIQPPLVTYKPNISQAIIDKGILSNVQLEAITYAGQSHNQVLPNGNTRGFFLGDGTGVGKGRTITGVILDNYVQGRKKAVWLSENTGLVPDAKRDVKALFGNSDLVTEFKGGKYADKSLVNNEGILFTTYSALSKSFDQSGSNFEKIVNWLGKDFDGVIVFDEAHNMANATNTKGTRGVKKASQRGIAGLAIQNALPNAKIIYSSATGATEVENLRYAERLGLWGEGTAFPNGDDFVHKIKAGGLAAMELIARDMKAMGVYLSRNISYEDVAYDKIVHELTPEQRQIYDELARAWQIVLQNLNEALKTTNQNKDGTAKGKAYGAFWSAEQRFFNQILTAMQVPSMLADIQKQLDNDNSIVIQLVSTNEAAQEREFTRLQEQELELEDFDLTPKQMLMSYIENSFPTVQFEKYVDDNGNTRSKPVYDSEGKAVINREAVKQKEMLLDTLGSIKVPASALDMIINHFGSDMVAENTGRKRRVVVKDGKAKEENIANKKEADVTAFQNGDKRIIVFSKAGGTGKSYHADKSAKNQQHRVHYLLQAGWQADAAVQGFGRSHRSNQVSSPTFALVTTDLKGQMRFISTIAKRLDQLGALTKGQRQTGSQGLFTAGDNLENEFAADILAVFYKALLRNDVKGVSDGVSVIEKLGLKDKLINEHGSINPLATELREVNKFLNRILSLECHEQNAVFDGYAERLHIATEKATQAGTLDKGLENYKADKVVLKESRDIRVDKTTGATTKYFSLTAYDKIKPLQFNDVDTANSSFLGFYQSKSTEAIRAVFRTSSITDEHGNVSDNCRLTGQDGNDYMPLNRLYSNWEKLSPEKAEELWNKAVSELPEFHTSNLHLIGGTVLPVWDKLPVENVRIYRVLTSDGDLLIGRVIPENAIDATLEKLGTEREKDNIKTEDLIKFIKNGCTVYLDNNWRIVQRRVSNEPRIELIGASYSHSKLLAKKGVFTERINFQTRYFIPAEKDTTKILDEVIKISPIRRVENNTQRTAAKATPSVLETLDKYAEKSKAMFGDTAEKTKKNEVHL
ncbi:MAG: bifunctional class I SAM-dependent methyltransferase/DEAD/DEAH box helicase [Defluviitaleaceae bacterium]|nr:bifunctional class I SAM-dependent methyltransferase/DEAD/DEAH box helicase [Defluviitaleaceae bacterium]